MMEWVGTDTLNLLRIPTQVESGDEGWEVPGEGRGGEGGEGRGGKAWQR